MSIMEQKAQDQIEAGIVAKEEQDYIRKAVELADGFRASGDVLLFNGPGLIACSQHNTSQTFRDALAAQLVRQVESQSAYNKIVISTGHVAIGTEDGAPRGFIAHHTVSGPDNSMNTLKCIVDSGVLEQCAK